MLHRREIVLLPGSDTLFITIELKVEYCTVYSTHKENRFHNILYLHLRNTFRIYISMKNERIRLQFALIHRPIHRAKMCTE